MAKYKGKLAEPLKRPRVRTILTADPQAEWAEHLEGATEVVEKMGLLLDHYGISRDEPERWHLLCLHLAGDHVPGFQFEKPSKAGRPKTWLHSGRSLRLYRDVQACVSEGHSALNACRILAKRDPYRNEIPAYTTLYRRYQDTKKNHPVIKMAEKMLESGIDPRLVDKIVALCAESRP